MGDVHLFYAFISQYTSKMQMLFRPPFFNFVRLITISAWRLHVTAECSPAGVKTFSNTWTVQNVYVSFSRTSGKSQPKPCLYYIKLCKQENNDDIISAEKHV